MRARRRELKAAREFVNALPQPRLVIPGNHDIPGMNHPVARFFQGFDRYRSAICDDLEPGLKMPGIHVVSLNSSRAFGIHSDWSEGRLSTRQLVSLREQFQTNPAGSLRILVLHHPLLALQIPGRAVVKPLAGLMQALEDARVDLVMCGHFHRSQLRATGLGGVWKTLISQAPTVCSTRHRGFTNFRSVKTTSKRRITSSRISLSFRQDRRHSRGSKMVGATPKYKEAGAPPGSPASRCFSRLPGKWEIYKSFR